MKSLMTIKMSIRFAIRAFHRILPLTWDSMYVSTPCVVPDVRINHNGRLVHPEDDPVHTPCRAAGSAVP
jgi:hypothetical protein